MHASYCAASSVLFAAVFLAGRSPAATGGSTASPAGTSATGSSGADARGGPQGAIAVEAAPQTTYTVQRQPPAGSCHFRYEKGEPLEEPACTPGVISPAVTQANLKSTICRKGGYTSGIRPSTSVTGKEKTLNAASYGYKGPMGDAEYDHRIRGQQPQGAGGAETPHRGLRWEGLPDGRAEGRRHRLDHGPQHPRSWVKNGACSTALRSDPRRLLGNRTGRARGLGLPLESAGPRPELPVRSCCAPAHAELPASPVRAGGQRVRRWRPGAEVSAGGLRLRSRP